MYIILLYVGLSQQGGIIDKQQAVQSHEAVVKMYDDAKEANPVEQLMVKKAT